MCKFKFDPEDDRIGVILVHGYVHDDIVDQIKAVIGDQYYTQEVYNEGCYTVTLVTTQPINMETAEEWVGNIYENEDDIPVVTLGTDSDYPAFVGIQDKPFEIVTNHDGFSFLFLGGIHGYEEDSCELYEDQ